MAMLRATETFIVSPGNGEPEIQIHQGTAYSDTDKKLKPIITRFKDRFEADQP